MDLLFNFPKCWLKKQAEIHRLVNPDVTHKAVFTNVPIIGFKNDSSLKDHLVWAV